MDGLLLVDKPAGLTSHDVVSRVRRIAKTRKVGHTGTLDPDATGLLPVTLNGCTRLANYLTLDQKVYEFTLVWGAETDTDDASGEVTARRAAGEADLRDPSPAEIEAALTPLRGEIMQRPPNYSAIRVDGQRAYDRARAGEVFELPERPVTVHELELLSVAPGEASLRMRSSSGTYVRSVVRDLGRSLGALAHTRTIRRIQVGGFDISRAVSLDALLSGEALIADHLLSPAEMMASLEQVTLDDRAVSSIRVGQRVRIAPRDELALEQHIALLDGAGALVAIGECELLSEEGELVIRPRRVMP